MPRAKKAPREIKSKYSIRNSVQRVVESNTVNTIDDVINAKWESRVDALAKAEKLQEYGREILDEIETDIKRAANAIVAKYAHPFMMPGYKWIIKGEVREITTDHGVHVSACLRTRYARGNYDYESKLEGAYLYLSLFSKTLTYINDTQSPQEMLDMFDKKVSALTDEGVEQTLTDVYMVDQSIHTGATYPKKANIKSWLRKWGMKATNGDRNGDYNNETGFLSTTDEDKNNEPCRGFWFNGPSSGSKDLREFAKFTKQMNQIKAELEKKKVFDRVERDQNGNRERYTFHLKVK